MLLWMPASSDEFDRLTDMRKHLICQSAISDFSIEKHSVRNTLYLSKGFSIVFPLDIILSSMTWTCGANFDIFKKSLCRAGREK